MSESHKSWVTRSQSSARVFAVFFLMVCFLGCGSSEPQFSDAGYITVWIREDMKVGKVIEEPHLVLELQSAWLNKVVLESPASAEYDFFIDGLVDGRLRYNSETGQIRLLGMASSIPIYKLSDPEHFNALVVPNALKQ